VFEGSSRRVENPTQAPVSSTEVIAEPTLEHIFQPPPANGDAHLPVVEH
jgi:hypothetical protein